LNQRKILLKKPGGISFTTDQAISDTLRLEYKIALSKEELLEFVNHLVADYPEYPSWSKTYSVPDGNRHNEAGRQVWTLVLNEPETFSMKAYLEFKKVEDQVIHFAGFDNYSAFQMSGHV